MQIEHPIRFHAKAMCHPAASTVERHVRHLGVGDQHVDVCDGVLTVALDQSGRRALDHVDRSLALGHVVVELSDSTFRADEAEYDEDTHLFKARGNVYYRNYERNEVFYCDTAEYNTEEGYGELDIPIIKNGFVESLDGNMAGRITDYSTSGMVETWKVGLDGGGSTVVVSRAATPPGALQLSCRVVDFPLFT